MYGIKKQLIRAIAFVGLCAWRCAPSILLLKSLYMYEECPKIFWVRHCYLQHIFLLNFEYLFRRLVNETYSNLKFNVFAITGSIFSNKYWKQVVLINHSWISPTLQKGWWLEFCLFFKKWGRILFSPRKVEVGKIVE